MFISLLRLKQRRSAPTNHSHPEQTVAAIGVERKWQTTSSRNGRTNVNRRLPLTLSLHLNGDRHRDRGGLDRDHGGWCGCDHLDLVVVPIAHIEAGGVPMPVSLVRPQLRRRLF